MDVCLNDIAYISLAMHAVYLIGVFAYLTHIIYVKTRNFVVLKNRQLCEIHRLVERIHSMCSYSDLNITYLLSEIKRKVGEDERGREDEDKGERGREDKDKGEDERGREGKDKDECELSESNGRISHRNNAKRRPVQAVVEGPNLMEVVSNVKISRDEQVSDINLLHSNTNKKLD